VDWAVALLIGLASGVPASLLALGIDRWLTERELRRAFAPLAGAYMQHRLDGQPILGANGSASTSSITYGRNGTLSIRSHTDYGDWGGHIRMDPISREFGSGTFIYDEAQRGTGLIQLVVLDPRDGILVHSTALSHVGLPPDAYMLKRARSSEAKPS
jgi:hypothetical protein